MTIFGPTNIMKEPSRVTRISSTCLDSVFTNIRLESIYGRGTINLHVSNHLARLINVRSESKPKATNSKTKRRFFSHENFTRFRSILREIDLGLGAVGRAS